MLYKVGLFCKLLLVFLGMSPNYAIGSNANEHNVNLNGNADGNNYSVSSNGARPDPTSVDKIYDTQNKWLRLFIVRSSFMKLGKSNYLCL